jgi:hypothetical protein
MYGSTRQVIALLELCTPEEQTHYEDLIGYEKPVEQLFVSVAERIIHRTNSLRLLSAAKNDGRSSSPSWVPDWSADVHIESKSFGVGDLGPERYSNAGGTARHLNIVDDVLSATGILVSKITCADEHIGANKIYTYTYYRADEVADVCCLVLSLQLC